MSLYRKYRPQKFTDLVGQEHIKTALSNALKFAKFSHAYLFTGPKGSGKTTTARLLAKALNCTGRALDDKNFEPCEECISCKEITSGQSMDVIEIDAASNRGIDEIRDLREKIRFAPTASRFKIYVIDECHMLTKEAFNALLKTLEEPPKHAIFILATTELQKVPATILSRVQVFDFHKAKIDEILLLLKRIVKQEKILIEEEALLLIAKLAYGAYRDAVNLLDQVANTGSVKENISLKEVQQILGQSTEASVWEFLEFLKVRDRNRSIELVESLFFEGKDLENFSSQTIEILRQMLLVKAGVNIVEIIEKEKLKKLAENFTTSEIINLIERLTEIMPKLKSSVLGQLPLEVLVFEFCISDSAESPVEVKVETKPIKIKEVAVSVKPDKPEPIIEAKAEPKVEKEVEVKVEEQTETVAELVSEDLKTAWANLVKEVKVYNNSLAAMLKDAQYAEQGTDKIVLQVKYKFHADQICNHKNRQVIDAAIKKFTGRVYELECIVNENLKSQKPVDNEEELLSSAKEVFDI